MSNFVDAPVLSSGHRVSCHKDQGGRHHMEDVPVFVRNNYDGVPEGVSVEPYDYIAIFDGHGGNQASEYASQHLLQDIICQEEFWSTDDADIQSAIRKGFIDCHYKMWKASKDWPHSSPGIMCTAGTTASVAFVRRGKVYVGHVGDSGIALGKLNEFQLKNLPSVTPQKTLNGHTPLQNGSGIKRQEPYSRPDARFEAMMLTKDHKPESPEEKERIESLGGEVRCKSGVYRVVWKRPLTLNAQVLFPDVLLPINPVPFLAVARSLGDFWSYEEERKEFVVSPVPDVAVHTFPLSKHSCLIAGSDGLWNVLRPHECLEIVEETYRLQELWVWQCLRAGKKEKIEGADVNAAELLVRKVLNRCELRKMRSDNVGVVIYYPQPSQEKIQLLLDRAADRSNLAGTGRPDLAGAGRPDLAGAGNRSNLAGIGSTSLYPWMEDPDVGVAQYRHSLLHLQNMVSCLGQNRILMSAMEISFRIDMIGFTPRMRWNPLREAGKNGDATATGAPPRDVPFDIDPFSPQCAVVLTREDETVRVPAYESLVVGGSGSGSGEEEGGWLGTGGGGVGGGGVGGLSLLNPLRRRTTDVLLSQRIKFLRTHSSNVIEGSVEDTSQNGAGSHSGTGLVGLLNGNGHKRLKTFLEGGEDGEECSVGALSCARQDLEQIGRMEAFAPF